MRKIELVRNDNGYNITVDGNILQIGTIDDDDCTPLQIQTIPSLIRHQLESFKSILSAYNSILNFKQKEEIIALIEQTLYSNISGFQLLSYSLILNNSHPELNSDEKYEVMRLVKRSLSGKFLELEKNDA